MSRKYQNHVIDPTFFYDAIQEFNFTYDWIIETEKQLDEYGRLVHVYTNTEIQGSLQSQGIRVVHRKEGNYEEMEYKFYCKSLYRIKENDFILYKGKHLMVTEVNDYDEYGVREATLKMVQLNQYQDLKEYLKFLEGDLLV